MVIKRLFLDITQLWAGTVGASGAGVCMCVLVKQGQELDADL